MSATPRSRQQFVIVRNVSATAERVFDVVISPAGMKAWVPMCRSAVWRHPAGTRGPGVGSVRVIEMPGGIVAEETIVYWKAGRQLNYRFAASAPLTKVAHDYEGMTRVESTGPASCRLTWAIHFDAPGALAVLAPVVRLSLRGLIGLMVLRVVRISERH
ncbi:SRPBCC family protein [Hydrocarboniphaga sp.]|uniref:SRPBCC family protein n=1 Tax=Hydrocarboniphaga sp. TaxID=2033016 RepID=UPI003D15093D